MPEATWGIRRHPPNRVWPRAFLRSYRAVEMRSLLRTLASALSAALLLPALASALAPCGMPECPMVECGAPASEPGHDCCPPADASMSAPCCEQRVSVPVTPPRLVEERGAPAMANAVVLSPLPAISEMPSRPAEARAGRSLDCLSQSCVLRN